MASSTYNVQKQEFLNSVVNKIGKQIYSSTAYVNPLKRLKKGFIENSSDIEEIYVARALGAEYDADGAGALDRVKPEVSTMYHQESWERAYTVTTQDKQVRKGFLSKDGVSRLANEIVESMHTGAEYEEYLQCIELLKDIAEGAKFKKTVADVKDIESAKAFVKEVKKTINKMARRSEDFAQVENHCKPDQMVLLLNEDWDVEIDVELLASAFNMDKTKLDECVKILIPDLGNGVKAMLMDERALQIYDLFYEVEPQRNAKGKFTNHHLTVEKMFSWSNLVNVAVFKVAE